jgi:hypothetical protein
MKSLLILTAFTAFYGVIMWMASILEWIVKNPSLHTDSVGYMPWLIIAFGLFLTPHILKRKLK